MKINVSYILTGLFVGILAFQLFIPAVSHATLVDDLQKQIDQRNATIAALQKEIDQYEAQVTLTSKQATTLKNLISTLDTTKKKLDAQITQTQNQIAAAQLNIDKLGGEIKTEQSSIDQNSEALAETVRRMNQVEDTTLFESVLSDKDLSTFLDDVQNLADVQNSVKDHIETLKGLRQDLQVKQDSTQKSQHDLMTYKGNLADQQKAVVYSAQEKNKLLTQTKSQEAAYQKLLQQKIDLKNAVQSEINDYEAQLKIAINPNSLPLTGSSPLSWPLPGKIRVTQYFGNTSFAQEHAAVYNGNGHPGIDLAASIGTKVLAALSGTVLGTGNTDTVCPGGSWGKWVVITHGNGLSTLYAHLSVISVSAGQSVTTGQTIGLSGETGYATGPHLHFTVLASQGVQIVNLPSKACKGIYIMPVAPLAAYLNPLSYLPALP